MQAVSKRPYNVILTGGIGSGKTAVSDLFGAHDVPIIDTDIIARQVVSPDSKGLSMLVNHFGSDILDADSRLDRAKLRQIVFSNQSALETLNNIIHPLIHQEVIHQLNSVYESPYAITVVPLFDKASTQYPFDRVLVVDVCEDNQIQRASNRDKCTPEHIESIISMQATRSERLEWADDIIDNNGHQSELSAQVAALHKQYLWLSNQNIKKEKS